MLSGHFRVVHVRTGLNLPLGWRFCFSLSSTLTDVNLLLWRSVRVQIVPIFRMTEATMLMGTFTGAVVFWMGASVPSLGSGGRSLS